MMITGRDAVVMTVRMIQMMKTMTMMMTSQDDRQDCEMMMTVKMMVT